VRGGNEEVRVGNGEEKRRFVKTNPTTLSGKLVKTNPTPRAAGL
jgi:hypothetical protein